MTLLCQFWEVKEKPVVHSTLTSEERTVLNHFDVYHSRDSGGRFMCAPSKEAHIYGAG